MNYCYKKLFTLKVHDALSFYTRGIAFASTVTAEGNSNILKGALNINSGCNWVAGKMSQWSIAFCTVAVSYYTAFAGGFDEEYIFLGTGWIPSCNIAPQKVGATPALDCKELPYWLDGRMETEL